MARIRSGFPRIAGIDATTQSGAVELHDGLYGKGKYMELGRHSFGLHLRQREAFGIAVAEMIKMGVVPFVPAGGAPAEIVVDDRLTFKDDEGAVETIDRFLRGQQQIVEVRTRLASRAECFSKQNFVHAVWDLLGSDGCGMSCSG